MLNDFDRPHLTRAAELARSVRKPPRKLGLRVEPVWAAVLATGEREIASAAYRPGDTQDAIQPLLGQAEEGSTLYLTLEPKAGFDRLPPVTETIRRLGVKRVVLGTLDPSHRYRGEGQLTLERMGIEVVIADGEEARLAQQILDDYSKWLRGVAVLSARVELKAVPDSLAQLKVADSAEVSRADAVLCTAGKTVNAGDSWLVVLDPQGWERPSEKKILYQSAEGLMVAGARKLPFRDGMPDLGALLRDLAALGIMSVELCGDTQLFRQALSAGLVDSVLAQFPGDSSWVISQVDRVRLADEDLELRLGDARLLDKQSLEARVALN
jgi:pyrimidine deaminase RibD-like protein